MALRQLSQLRTAYAINFTAAFHPGKQVEVDETGRVYTKPCHKLTGDYITGRFG